MFTHFLDLLLIIFGNSFFFLHIHVYIILITISTVHCSSGFRGSHSRPSSINKSRKFAAHWQANTNRCQLHVLWTCAVRKMFCIDYLLSYSSPSRQIVFLINIEETVSESNREKLPLRGSGSGTDNWGWSCGVSDATVSQVSNESRMMHVLNDTLQQKLSFTATAASRET